MKNSEYPIMIFRKRSLAIVPVHQLKIKISADIFKAQLALWGIIWEFKYFESSINHSIKAMDEVSFVMSWQMIDYKRKHPIRFRLLQALGIY